jgi:drug/metabolite transporter (DMT)-like permease
MRRLAIITGLISAFLFGIATPFSKLLLSGFNSFQLAGLLYLGAGIAMTPSILKGDSQIKMLFKYGNRAKTIGIIFFGGFLGPILLLFGLRFANAASVSIWLNLELVATAILGVLIFRDTLDKLTWIGVALTVLAGVITTFGERFSGITSALIITAACFCWGIDNHLTALTDGASPQTVTFVKGIVAGSFNLILGFLITDQSIQFDSIVIALVLGAFSYGLSIVLYVTSAQNIGATRGQILFSTAPLWGVIISYILFHGSFQWVHLVSMIILVLAVILTNVISHGHVHEHVSIEHIHYHKHDEHHNHSHGNNNSISDVVHSHKHSHKPIMHKHPHYPDLHHRHNHK